MNIIAESGSTKTIWKVLSENDVETFETIGLNPYFTDHTTILEVIGDKFPAYADPEEIARIRFYGSGCAFAAQKELIQNALNEYFKKAEVEVHSDLLGSSIALHGDKPGMVCILGTGASSCIYNGSSVVLSIPSLGYILGDEGSGAYLGMQLMKLWGRDELTESVNEELEREYHLTFEILRKELYSGSNPNRYLSGFASFIKAHLSQPVIKELVQEAFSKLFQRQLLKYLDYKNYPLGFTGSVAFHYKDLLLAEAERHGFKVSAILPRAIDLLVERESDRR